MEILPPTFILCVEVFHPPRSLSDERSEPKAWNQRVIDPPRDLGCSSRCQGRSVPACLDEVYRERYHQQPRSPWVAALDATNAP